MNRSAGESAVTISLWRAACAARAAQAVAALVVLAALAGCALPASAPGAGGASTPDATAAAAATAIAVALLETPTPAPLTTSATGGGTLTWQQMSTAAAQTLTAQPTSTPSVTPTPAPTDTPNPTATFEAMQHTMATWVALTLTAQPTDTPTPTPTLTPNLTATGDALHYTMQTAVAATLTAQPTDTPTRTPTRMPTRTPIAYSEMVLIPAGPFRMGCSPDDDQCSDDEKPLHEVTLDAYSIDIYEVTNARYAACVAAGGCTLPHKASSATRNPYYGNSAYARYPVINVDWTQASAFCAWEGKRLPTEAEWEKAARGSADTRIYPWGNSAPNETRLNFNGHVGDTKAVGYYPPSASPYGVMDMSGNVWEWVNDWYNYGYYSASPASNPQGPNSGEYRLLRGGSWNDYSKYVRASSRNRYSPDFWLVNIGFRCARSQ